MVAGSVLRFLACGSVDDGKSTLLGHLLHLTGNIHDDQLRILRAESERSGAADGTPDCPLPLDGLMAEREQGTTIDVAYRYFSTGERKFAVADTPGHESCPRAMVTAASRCTAALILIDARRGLLPQTRRHALICAMMGIRGLLFAVNKMDMVSWSEEIFRAAASCCDRLETELEHFAGRPLACSVVPVSALHGDNLATASRRMPWYPGPSILDWLLGFPPDGGSGSAPFPMPVSLELGGEHDVAGGDRLVPAASRPRFSSQFKARIVWMDRQPFFAGRQYLFRGLGGSATAEATRIRDRIVPETFQRQATDRLDPNDIGEAELYLSRPLPFDPCGNSRETGSFILIDRITNATVGRGMILHALRRATNLHWQLQEVSREERARIKGQRPIVIWFTGLSGSGKSTIANSLEGRLHAMGRHTTLLDGDNVRHGLNRDLGFTEADRIENIRRIGEVAKLMADAGLIVIAAFISPYRAERDMVRRLLPPGEFCEVYLSTPLEECERRDPKGLYRKARSGQIPNLTGIDSPYEAPLAPEIRLDAATSSVDECADAIMRHLEERLS